MFGLTDLRRRMALLEGAARMDRASSTSCDISLDKRISAVENQLHERITNLTEATQDAIRQFSERIDEAGDMHDALVHTTDTAISRIEARLQEATARGVKSLALGTRVFYVGDGSSKHTGRLRGRMGTVVATPRDLSFPRVGVSGEVFIYVMWDGNHTIYGCYPSRLAKA
jgi:hypothetical protein